MTSRRQHGLIQWEMLNWRRKRFWVAAVLLLFITVGVVFNLVGAHGTSAEIEKWRAEGLPTNHRELDEWYRAVPPHENAALAVIKAANLHVQPSEYVNKALKIDDPAEPLSKESQATLRDYIAQNEETLTELREALKLPGTRYPVALWQGFSALLPYLAPLKGLAQLLRAETLLYSSEGKRAEAVGGIHRSFPLSGTLREEPVLISELVRVAMIAINLTALERVLNEHQLTPEEIQLLLKDLEKAEVDGKRAMYRAFVGERANASFIVKTGFNEFATLGAGGAGPQGFSQLLGGSMFMLYKASGLRQRDVRIYIEMMGNFIASTTNPYPASVQLAERAEAETDERLNQGLGRLAIFSRMLLPALTKALSKEAVIAARLRCARGALLVEYQRARGNTLDDLGVLNFPADPFTGEPLTFERTEPGYRVRSPGATKIAATKAHPVVAMTVSRPVTRP